MRWTWMMVLVAAVVACVAGGASAAQFVELPALSGLTNGPGLGWGDYDGDGYADLFVPGENQGAVIPDRPPHAPLIFRNNHNLTFVDVSQAVTLPALVIEQDGVAWGDYDNDGDLDILVGSGAGRPMLYRQDVTPTERAFAEVAVAAGFPVGTSAGRGVAWCDYDADNWLDAFCSNIFGPGYLMHNDGDGTFTDVSASAGMTGDALNDSAQSASWGDYDNDGLPDIALARLAKPTKLYRNNGDGTFADVSATAGVAVAVDAWNAIWGDYDNDGWLDLYVTSASYVEPFARRDSLFHNNGNGTFTDVGATAGMAGDAAVGGDAAWGDYDSDGYLDLYVGNWGLSPFLYRNQGSGTFTNVVASSGLDVAGAYQSATAAWADMDRDGMIDLARSFYNAPVLLFHNTGPAGNWLRLRALTNVTGAATVSTLPSRDAIGARVDLNLDNDDTFPSGRTLTRMIDGGSGYCGQGEQVAQFGVGGSSLVCVRVLFPDGSVVTHRSVPVNRQIVILDVPADRTLEPFGDVPLDHWGYEQILGCVDAGIVGGYPNGTYQPDWSVTRDQMAAYVARALAGGDGNVPAGPPTPTFLDVAPADICYKYIEHAVSNQVVFGYGDGLYHPTYEVDRGTMAVFIARATATPVGEPGMVGYVPPVTPTFTDVTPDPLDPYQVCYKYVEYIADAGVTQGYPDGLYHPEYVVTRGLMAIYVARAFGLL